MKIIISTILLFLFFSHVLGQERYQAKITIFESNKNGFHLTIPDLKTVDEFDNEIRYDFILDLGKGKRKDYPISNKNIQLQFDYFLSSESDTIAIYRCFYLYCNGKPCGLDISSYDLGRLEDSYKEYIVNKKYKQVVERICTLMKDSKEKDLKKQDSINTILTQEFGKISIIYEQIRDSINRLNYELYIKSNKNPVKKILNGKIDNDIERLAVNISKLSKIFEESFKRYQSTLSILNANTKVLSNINDLTKSIETVNSNILSLQNSIQIDSIKKHIENIEKEITFLNSVNSNAKRTISQNDTIVVISSINYSSISSDSTKTLMIRDTILHAIDNNIFEKSLAKTNFDSLNNVLMRLNQAINSLRSENNKDIRFKYQNDTLVIINSNNYFTNVSDSTNSIRQQDTILHSVDNYLYEKKLAQTNFDSLSRLLEKIEGSAKNLEAAFKVIKQSIPQRDSVIYEIKLITLRNDSINLLQSVDTIYTVKTISNNDNRNNVNRDSAIIVRNINESVYKDLGLISKNIVDQKPKSDTLVHKIDFIFSNTDTIKYNYSTNITKPGSDTVYYNISTTINEKLFAENLAPKINYLNMDTYVGPGAYIFNVESNKSWFQPLNVHFSTRLDTIDDSNWNKKPWNFYKIQPFLDGSLQTYSERGASINLGYGVRFLNYGLLNYVSVGGYLGGAFITTDNWEKSTQDSLVKSFYDTEIGIKASANIYFSKPKIQTGISLGVSGSLKPIERTYNLYLKGSEPKKNIIGSSSASFYILSIEPYLSWNIFRLSVGCKFNIVNKDYKYKYASWENLWYLQLALRLNKN